MYEKELANELPANYKELDINGLYDCVIKNIKFGDTIAPILKRELIDGEGLYNLKEADIKSILPLGAAMSLIAAIKKLNQGNAIGLPFHIQTRDTINRGEGIVLQDPTIISRTQRISELTDVLDKNKYILIKSPPYTGKTSMGQLMEDHLKKTKPTSFVRRLSFIWENLGFEHLWMHHTGKLFQEWLLIAAKEPVYLILDECQVIYPSDHPWSSIFWPLIKQLTGNIHILMLSAYGEKPGSGAATPQEISESNILSYNAIFFSPTETLEIISKFEQSAFPLSQEVKNWIISNCLNHPGLISRTLNEIKTRFQGELRNIGGIPLDLNGRVYQFLLSSSFYQSVIDSRAAPEIDKFSVPEKEILDHITKYQKLDLAYGTANLVHYTLVKRGFLILTKTTNNDITYHLSFPSPLYLKCYYIQRYHHSSTLEDFIVTPTEKGFEDLIIGSIRNFRSSNLQSEFSSKKNLFGEIRPYETLWQQEFYYAASGAKGPKFISPNVGNALEIQGFVDFYINGEYKWAIEMVSEGDRLQEHLDRFTIGGKYENLLGIVSKWCVIDFRAKFNTIVHVENLWVIQYSQDFKTFTIHRHKQNPITIQLK